MDPLYHPGELAVQAAAGDTEQARRVGKSIRETIPPAARGFLAAQQMIVLGSLVEEQVWTTALTGPPGFVRAAGDRLITVATAPATGDPLAAGLQAGDEVGLLAIDPATRRRMRLNGIVRVRSAAGLTVEAIQVYANCPKYIQAREIIPADADPSVVPQVIRSSTLTSAQAEWVEGSDTFFIGTVHPTTGADASHRGGQPGFVRVLGPDRLVFPDYQGNSMFQTLGNIAADPRAGLLFLDVDSGRTLHLTGRAAIDWDPDAAAPFAGAERVVDYRVEEVVGIDDHLPLRWRFLGHSPFNPR